ncbi:hypothetical protein DRQ53_10075 [bacterium]|nr:MAG: hypothetical protein DRQ53_10075 [bacterium]
MYHLILPLLLALAPAGDDGPMLDKPSGEEDAGLRRTVAEVSLRSPRPIDVLHYDLTLRTKGDNTYLRGEVRMWLIPRQDLDRIVLDFTTSAAAPSQGMIANAVEVDGQALPVVHDADSLVIVLPATITPADTVEVYVNFEGAPVRPQGVGFGWTRRFLRDEEFQPDPERPVLCSLSEPSGARTWWPCHDHPFDNATVTLTTISPPEFRLAAPGHMIVDEPFAGGLRRQVADMTTPIPAYLVSVVLTDQELWTDSMTVDELQSDGSVTTREMPLEYYAPAPLIPDAQFTWANTPEMIRHFERMFGPYPYADIKYGMSLFVFGGAMEHPTISSMGDFTVSQNISSLYPGPAAESIVAHELAHQWFGDAVHVGRWGDIWLNEGFARFCEILWLESFYGPKYGRIWLDRIWRSSYGGPVRDPDNLFSGTVYNKGAWILHQLRQVMGHDELLQAMRNYMTDPGLRFGPVFVEDFQAHCEAVYGESMDWYFTPWLEQAGRPALDVDWSVTAGGAQLSVSQPADRVYRLPLPVQLILADGVVQEEIVWIGDPGPVDIVDLTTTAQVVDLRVDWEGDWLLDLDVPKSVPVEVLGILPNPFNSGTTLRFVVRKYSPVHAEVFDLRGRRVRFLFSEELIPAVHDRLWDGRDDDGNSVASGAYIIRLQSNDYDETRKVTLVR